ncbi:FtsX-like permease family protein [Yinghuangia sp. YIM S09857]|uniref:FtsX-like permease family protein n=1 Tax=Yinghuangia sp. YIM S09857 TaxID=3436929 RepID=UPI003F5318F7
MRARRREPGKIRKRGPGRRYADLAGSFATLALGVAVVTSMLLTLASSATARGTGDDHDALVTTNALTGTAVGIAVFATGFVVASTFAFSVARRRRELALLRSVGATPGQVRRLVLREAFLLSVPAGLLGCFLGRSAAPELIDWLGEHELSPSWLTMRHVTWPYYTAFATGIAVALAGALVAARQAARVRPVEALRTAAVDDAESSRTRIVVGAVLLASAVAYLGFTAVVTPGEAIHRKHRTLAPMLVVPGVALLAPALVGPPLRALGRVTRGREPVALELARSGVLASPRRTAATVAPVLMTVALAVSLLGATDTVDAAKVRDAEQRITAELVVQGALPADELRVGEPDLAVVITIPTQVSLTPAAAKWVELDALAVDPATLATVMDLEITAGSLADLADDAIVVPDGWAQTTIGAVIPVRMADGTERSLRIAAVVAEGTGGTPALLTLGHAPPGAEPLTLVNRPDGEPGAQAEAAVRAAAARTGAAVHTAAEWARADVHGGTEERRRLAVYFVLGVALLYAGVAIANTTAMSTADQAPVWRALRMSGATRAQVARTAAVEATLMVVLGVLLGVLAAAATLVPLWTAIALLIGPGPVSLPWREAGAAVAACAAIAVPAALLSVSASRGVRGEA